MTPAKHCKDCFLLQLRAASRRRFLFGRHCDAHFDYKRAYLSAVRHKAINQCVTVIEQSMELLGGLYGQGGSRAELLPLHWHWTAAGRRHTLHLTRHLRPNRQKTKGSQVSQGRFILWQGVNKIKRQVVGEKIHVAQPLQIRRQKYKLWMHWLF